ncbi:MAG: hypothetical protein SPL30_01075 [Succinivibrio sp.]|jgi:hypothetical protein|nr:hypothetical protein [Succinivibrio sp.]
MSADEDRIDTVDLGFGQARPEEPRQSEDDASENPGETGQAPIEGEIAQTFKALGAVKICLEHVVKLIKNAPADQTAKLLKIIRPACINVENSLPMLHDFEDNLLSLGDEDTALRVRRDLAVIEDELLPQVLNFLDQHPLKQEQ